MATSSHGPIQRPPRRRPPDLICGGTRISNIFVQPTVTRIDRRIASFDTGGQMTRETWRAPFDAQSELLRCGCDGCVLGAAIPRAGSALPGLAVPAAESAGDCGRQRLERSLDRG